MPKLSICTTNYNCAHALKSHLDSIYSQLDEQEFEYIVVDSQSKDESWEILKVQAALHDNMTILQKKCIRGIGRQMAFEISSGDHILQVDTDTIYLPNWKIFIDGCMAQYPYLAVQAIYGGIYPRKIMEEVGGWRNFQWGDDFDLWMRIWKLGKMRWYPVAVGKNVKEAEAESFMDAMSYRYKGKFEKSLRMLRTELDRWRLHREMELDLPKILKDNSVDFKLGEEQVWLHQSPKISFPMWAMNVLRKEKTILKG